MSDDPVTWVFAALELITALGFVAFWVTWWREPHDEPWLPAGYVEHEAPFVFSDALVVVTLIAAAVLQVAEQPSGRWLALVAAGMLLFLGVLDLAYFARTGLFKREHGGVVNAGVVAWTLIFGLLLIVRFA